jgi:hypothetical protein
VRGGHHLPGEGPRSSCRCMRGGCGLARRLARRVNRAGNRPAPRAAPVRPVCRRTRGAGGRTGESAPA